MARAWKLRKAGEPLLYGMAGLRKPVTFVEDTAVDPARLCEYIARFRALVEKHGTTAAYYAHASVGCLHIRPLICLADPKDRQLMQHLAEDVTELVCEFDGALSGEHGDGRLRSHLLERFYGREICAAFDEIKQLFDPEHRLNPGIITDPPPMTADLRVLPENTPIHVPTMRTYFRHEAEGGFAQAVKMCHGAGLCRKTGEGTMCPSYRATRDERHSTRGRGNTLRLAITGQLSPNGEVQALNDPETLRTLDLCLSCKACKSECPSNVDLARLKAEYLAQSYDVAGVPLRVRPLGYVRGLLRMASIMPGLSNALANFPPVRGMINRALGLAPEHSLPRVGRSPHRRSDGPVEAPAVVLFADCFTTYSEPEIGRAARRVLQALGYRVIVPKHGCCGRPMISNGLLRRAQIVCRDTARALLEVVDAERPVAIVTCEPSCASAMVDDWLDLEMDVDQQRLRELASLVVPVEDFIEREWDMHPCRPPTLKAQLPGAGVVVHGHCHQKALGDLELTLAALRRVTDGEVQLIEAGCCGMAGVFGLQRDHYELSMQIAELALLPALHAEPDALAAAAGASCRHQIRDALDRRVLHPIEVIAAAFEQASR